MAGSEQLRYPKFTEYIEEHMNQERVPDSFGHIECGEACVDIRLRGGFVTDFSLLNGKILYAPGDSDLLEPKLRASHPMVPAGPSEGIGDQHGPFRWTDYHVIYSTDSEMALQTARPDLGLGSARFYKVGEDSLTIEHRLLNSEGSPERTGVGEHFYFQLPGELDGTMLDQIRVNDKNLEEVVGDKAKQQILSGQFLIIRNAFGDGPVRLTLPNHEIELSAELLLGRNETQTDTPVDLWVWHLQDSASICFEPVAGVVVDDNGAIQNQGLTIEPYDLNTFSTRITVKT